MLDRPIIESMEEIAAHLNMTPKELEDLERINKAYPVRVTSYYLSLIDQEDPEDPVRKMCIPFGGETELEGETDTSGEQDNTVITGMQHKYRQTGLILSTNQCAMYCRHCFRKRMVGSSMNEIASHIPEMVEYVNNHPEIDNVLITGGDALMNSNKVIEYYLESFSEIDHLRYIRLGTRIPVVLPQRIIEDQDLQKLLKAYNQKKQIFIVTHFNHPNEITDQSVEALHILQSCGCVIRNQTVFLKGVNDDPHILAELLNLLVKVGVVPYYIFQCRPVKGARDHFQIPLKKAHSIISEARRMMSGQAKSARYVMSHPKGKIEILGHDHDTGEMIFRFHQAKYEEDQERIFTRKLENDQAWLDANLQ